MFAVYFGTHAYYKHGIPFVVSVDAPHGGHFTVFILLCSETHQQHELHSVELLDDSQQ
jgi:hypothetical protein